MAPPVVDRDAEPRPTVAGQQVWDSAGVSEERRPGEPPEPTVPLPAPTPEPREGTPGTTPPTQVIPTPAHDVASPTAVIPPTATPSPPAGATASVNITRLTHEAATKSGLLWVRLPGGDTHPVWHVWHDDGDERGTGPAAYVVSGPGEQSLPWLPDEVELILRSKDTGGRLLTLRASAREIAPDDPGWAAAVELLRAERLNAVGDVAERWRQHCTIHALTPHGRPVEAPGSYGDEPGSQRVLPSAEATARWRPWHWRGRAGARRNTSSST